MLTSVIRECNKPDVFDAILKGGIVSAKAVPVMLGCRIFRSCRCKQEVRIDCCIRVNCADGITRRFCGRD
jgi:hypothetical protein